MTDQTLEQRAQALIAEWRERAADLSGDDLVGLTHKLNLVDCATELETALQQAQQPGAQAVVVETVGFVRTDNFGDKYVAWTIEGGIDALQVGDELIASAEKLTDENGFGEVYTAPPPPSLLDVSDGFYLASFKGVLNDEVLWWRPNDSGYTTDLDSAGVYTAIKPGYHDSEHTVPVPVAFVESLTVRRVLNRADQNVAFLWNANKLRDEIESYRARHAKGGA